MGKGRLEAFSDGVIAIIITIMVLELKAPHGASPEDLLELAPVFLSYVLSFLYVGIYWNNHHHLLSTVRKVTAGVMWANLHLLFWLSLLPFTTAWTDENHFQQWPVFFYCLNLLLCGAAYTILQGRIIASNGGGMSELSRAVGRDAKSWISIAGYVTGMIATSFQPMIAVAITVCVALVWLIPDRRLEKIAEG